MIEAGRYYTEAHGQDLLERHEAAIEAMVEAGAEQDPPVTIVEMSEEDRAAWVNNLPDLAGEWAASLEERGVDGSAFMKAYMDGLRERGEDPVRNWDENL